MLKKLAEMYGGAWSTVREHLAWETPIAKYMYETVRIPNTNFKTNGTYITAREAYEGYLGELVNRNDLPIVINGTAEMLAKVMLIRELAIDEKDVYQCKAIRSAVSKLSEYIHGQSWLEIKRLVKTIGQENVKALNARLDEGYVESFDGYEDAMITRALWLFMLFAFHKYHEIKWFGFLGCLSNSEVKHDIKTLANRMFETFLSMAKDTFVDFFPQYGDTGSITALGDIQIGNTLFLISCLDKNQWKRDVFYRSAVILDACANLSKHTSQHEIKDKMIYHVRWNAFTKVM